MKEFDPIKYFCDFEPTAYYDYFNDKIVIKLKDYPLDESSAIFADGLIAYCYPLENNNDIIAMSIRLPYWYLQINKFELVEKISINDLLEKFKESHINSNIKDFNKIEEFIIKCEPYNLYLDAKNDILDINISDNIITDIKNTYGSVDTCEIILKFILYLKLCNYVYESIDKNDFENQFKLLFAVFHAGYESWCLDN